MVVGTLARVGGREGAPRLSGEPDLGGGGSALAIGDVPGGKELKDGVRDGTFMPGSWR